jgi:hypothetical protein
MMKSTVKRGLSDSNIAAKYTDSEEMIIQILALIFASVSTVSTALTFYWFFTMRRSFRHQSVSTAKDYPDG